MNIMTKRGSQDNVNIYEHYCDTKADLDNIPKDQIGLGSTAIVLKDENGELGVYLADSNKEWIPISMSSGDSGTDTGESKENDIIMGTLSGVYENSVATKIKFGAFEGCASLTAVNFPVCTTIESRAFYECRSLESINFPMCSLIESEAFKYCNITAADFPLCSFISGSAFANCYNLETISFPNCTNIGEYSFYENSAIT